MATPIEKVQPRPETTQAKETTHRSPLVETITAFVNTIQKVNDLGAAKEALITANDLFAKGKEGEARELSLKIFGRLKQIGKLPERLDIATIQQRTSRGQYDKLIEDIEKVRDQGETKNEIRPKELIERLKKVSTDKKSDPKDPEYDIIKAEMDVEVKTREPSIVVEEKRLQAELVKLLEKLELKTTNTSIKDELHNVRGVIDAGFIGQVDAELQIDKLKDRIKETKVKAEKKAGTASISDNLKVVGKLATGDISGALDQLGNNIQKGPKGEQIFVKKLTHLVSGIEKVKERMGNGIGIQEAVRTLDEDEIREVRAMLSSTREIPDPENQSPYYDKRYVEFIAEMQKNMGKDELLGFAKMLDVVDVNYKQAVLESESPVDTTVKIPGVRKARPTSNGMRNERFVDESMIKGGGESGMDIGLMTDEQAEIWLEDGQKYFDEIMEPLPNGSFRERSFTEQLSRKEEQYKKIMLQQGYQKLEQRESFLNINMQNLFDYMKKYDEANGKNYYDMIDIDYYLENGVAKLHEKYMNPGNKDDIERKKEFEMWWYQEVSFNQRGLAYEGLFDRRNQSPRMQRLNSLMEIIGVETTKKGLANWMASSYGTIDQQNNSYVNAEFMGKLAAFWTNQGVDFRLEDMLKEYREDICLVQGKDGWADGEKGEVVGSISVFDAVSFMQQDVPMKGDSVEGDALRAKLGIPDWWKGKFGTMIYKYSESGKRNDTRRIIWDHFLEKELGVDLTKIDSGQQQSISNKYQLMFDLGFQYSVIHKQLHMMVGNASFQKGELELPAAAAEMHLKLDPLAYPKLFAPRFQFLNVAFKEAWALFDPGVRDYITMAPQDYASHLMEKSIGVDGKFRKTTDAGAPTIGETFLGFGTSASEAELKAEEELFKIFNGSLWHWGVEPGKGVDHEMDIYLQLGVHGDQKSSFRRGAGDMTKQLLQKGKDLSPETLKMIKWDKYLEMTHNPIIKRKMDKETTPEGKWRVFAETFGEHSYNHSAPAAKRSGDHPVKYGVENFNKYVEAFLAFASDPFNPEKLDALLDVPTAVNAAMVPGRAAKNLDFVLKMTERMGRAEIGGGGMHRFKRDSKKGTVHVDTSHGIGGKDDNEWPAIDMEPIRNSNFWWDAVQNKSIPESVGIGIPVDKQIILDLIKGQRAKGRLPDDTYRKYYRKIVNSVLWETKLGVPANLYRLITLTSLTDWLGPQLGITGYEFRKVIGENTEKTASGFFKYLNG